MSGSHQLSDAAVERLIRGEAPPGHRSLEQVAALVRDAHAFCPEVPTPSTQARHMAAMMAAARQAVGDPRGEGPERGGRRLEAWWGRRSPAPARRQLAGALTLGLAGMVALTTLGALPEPVQARLADAAEIVGISFPNPEDEVRPPPRRRTSGASESGSAAGPVSAPHGPAASANDRSLALDDAVGAEPDTGCDAAAGSRIGAPTSPSGLPSPVADGAAAGPAPPTPGCDALPSGEPPVDPLPLPPAGEAPPAEDPSAPAVPDEGPASVVALPQDDSVTAPPRETNATDDRPED